MPCFTCPIAPTASRNAFIMWVDVTCLRCPLTVTVKIGESWNELGGFPILFTIAAAALSGQRRAPYDAIMVTIFICSAFFCCSTVRAMQSANSSYMWLWPSCSTPLKNLTFLSLRILVLCCLGFVTLRYLQRRMAKNIPTVAISPVAYLSLVLSWQKSLLMMERWIIFLGALFCQTSSPMSCVKPTLR